MKYFTKDICSFDLNSGDPEKLRKATEKGEVNLRKYRASLNKTLSRMPKKYWSFFERNCQLADGQVHKILLSNVHLTTKCNNYLEIYVDDPESCGLYILKYANVRKCVFDYPSKLPIYEDGRWGYGDWFADELTLSKDDWFIHEIVFNTGATLLIEFEKFSLSRKN
ncbi:MAG: hypothetical protein IH624_17295 [Phycisphaerae bacterium]|nr:hypothetical protein [Phycisphaerae bacterium]